MPAPYSGQAQVEQQPLFSMITKRCDIRNFFCEGLLLQKTSRYLVGVTVMKLYALNTLSELDSLRESVAFK